MAAVPALFRFVDASGDDAPGAKLYTYTGGTTTPQAVYTDNTLTTPLSNPAVADAYGRLVCWFDADLIYKGIAKTSDDATTLLSFDNYDPSDRDILQLIGSDATVAAVQAALSAAEAAGYATAAAASAAAAAASEAGVDADATAAEASATAAAASQSAAATSATNAATSETNAATSATASASSATASASSASDASDSADAADLDAISANLAEDEINRLLAILNFFEGGPYADVDAAVTAGAEEEQLFLKSDDTLHKITGVGPNTSFQVSPMTAQQGIDLDNATTVTTNVLIESFVDLTGVVTDKGFYTDNTNSLATYDLTAYGRSLGGVANEAAFKALVNLEIGTDVQAYDADLAALAALTTTTYGRGFNELADASAARTKLALGSIATSALTVSTSAPSGTPANNAIWLRYTP